MRSFERSRNDHTTEPHEVVIIGAGPAGLTAAYKLVQRGVLPTVLEADTVVGGISRTAERDGWRFDIGGHRFFTKVKAVDDLWFEILGADEFLRRPRMSRIFYNGKLYDYPLKPMNALRNLGIFEALRCVASYLWVRIRPPKDQSTFEGFTAARFGWRLYRTFFKTYTEKVWGVPATALQADWGAQRIKDLSLIKAVVDALTPKAIKKGRAKGKQVTSLIEEFNYPKYGPGQMWERCTELVTAAGAKVHFESPVTGIRHAQGRAYEVAVTNDGATTTYRADQVLSSMPINELVLALEPAPPAPVLDAARGLKHRDFLTVALVVPHANGFPDNWIYIHDPGVKVGRIQNFGSWSPYLVKEGRTCLGLEYFVNVGDDVWNLDDDALVVLGTKELERLGLVTPGSVEAGYVVRMPKAYPVYDADYHTNVATIRAWLTEHVTNVHPVGRNGMHKYNNQDHSMYTAMLAVENICGADHDVWSVNVEAEYHEADATDDDGEVSPSALERGTGRMAPVVARR
ncbi:MAG: NAD(P)/FAD-dependent oxidoreductase [Acidimicrobiia bacterium]